MALPPLDPRNVSALDQFRTMTPEQAAAYMAYLQSTGFKAGEGGSGLAAAYQPFSDATANIPNANPTAGYGGYQLSGAPLTESGATPFFSDLNSLNQAYGTSFTPGQVPTAETVGSRARGDANTASNFDNLMQNTAIAALAYGGGSALGSLGAAGEAVPAGAGTAGAVPVAAAPAAAAPVAAGVGGSNTGLLAGAGVAGATPALAGAGGAGTGAASEEAMIQAMRNQELGSLSGAGISPGGTAAGTPLSRILNGTYTTADLLSVGGNAGSTLLGVLGSRNQGKAYGDLTNQYMGMGAPSRARYEASMTPGFDPMSIPGYSGAIDTASKGLLARLAATGGNPYGNPGGMIEANKQIISGTALPAIDAYQRLNAGTGGYAGFNAAAPAAANAGINARADVYGQLGSGLAGLLSPQPSLLETLRGLGVQGLS